MAHFHPVVRRKKSTRAPGYHTSILNEPPLGLVLLGTIRLNLTNLNSKNFKIKPVPIVMTNNYLEPKITIFDDIILPSSSKGYRVFSSCLTNVKLVFNQSSTNDELCLDVYPKKLPMANAEILVENIFGKSNSFDGTLSEDNTWDELIKELVVVHASRAAPSANAQHPDLKPQLRNYQASAVIWMLQRETEKRVLNLDWLTQVADILQLPNEGTMLFNKYTRTLYQQIEATPLHTGGILSDEMGLGKTVVTLAVILSNPRKKLPNWKVNKHPIEATEESGDEGEPSEREKNLETSLSPSEKLQRVPTKLGKGMLKRHLTAWYVSKLAETVPKKKAKRNSLHPFKCVCGIEGEKNPKNQVQCSCCTLRQHPKCVGYVNKGKYVCPACWKLQEPLPARASLIIAPPAIFQQWAKEMERHTPSLKVYLYNGMKNAYVQPNFLADFDVVITTFHILRSETSFGNETSQRAMRNDSRFLRRTAPLEYVNWWRVVCDEAQMFESDASLIRVMVTRLSAVHRWCVTGTPIQRGIADLFYLTSFMGMGPLDDKKIWNDFLLQPYLAGCKEPLLLVLGDVFWRSTKEQVAGELNIPSQTFQRHLLKFSAIETFFYTQLHQANALKFEIRLIKSQKDWSTSLASLSKTTIKRLLQPLLNLRQACTHAQIVSGINILREGKVSNLKELLDYLCKKTKKECDDALREHVSALNGIAGLHWLLADRDNAINNYKRIIQLSEENKNDTTVDTLQLIHTLTNLSILLNERCGSEPDNIEDYELISIQASELERKYLERPEKALLTNIKEVKALRAEVNGLYASFEVSKTTWWIPVLLALESHEVELVSKLQEQLESNDFREKKISKAFLKSVDSIRKIEIVLRRWWQDLEIKRQKASETIHHLLQWDCGAIVEDALECHLRNTKHSICQLCCAETKLTDYECQLFAVKRKNIKHLEKVLDGADTRGSWELHLAARTLFIIFNFAKGRIEIDPMLKKDGITHGKLIESMKKEFKKLRAVWTSLNNRVHAEDELTMAKWRFRFAEPWEKTKVPPTQKELALMLSTPEIAQKLHVILPEQIPGMLMALQSNDSYELFKRKQGRMFYLKNIGENRSVTPDPCPICRGELVEFWCVLPCGHCFCPQCIETLRGSAFGVHCPVCRSCAAQCEVFYVKGQSEMEEEVKDKKKILGNYSTKVDSVVAEVIRLMNVDKDIKILIFSSWADVLKILTEALTKNNIQSLSLPSPKHQKVLEDFRNVKSGIPVLLLPLSWGSKGLNLVEATHVFLVEPIMNPAEELQAIGRVHRMGQTRPTVVHRFIMMHTIEEKIFEVVSEASDTWSKKAATLEDLKDLFSIPAVPAAQM